MQGVAGASLIANSDVNDFAMFYVKNIKNISANKIL